MRAGAQPSPFASLSFPVLKPFCIHLLSGCHLDQLQQAKGIQREINVKGQKLGTVTSFKYLGAVVSDDGSKPEIFARIAQATAALTKLKPIWRDNNIFLGLKVNLMRSHLISIFLYACES